VVPAYRGDDSCRNVGDDGHDSVEVKQHEDGCEQIGQKSVVSSDPVLVRKGQDSTDATRK